ncbi:hypothetical protein AAEX28_06650 [Lentisphaerota bacterium WC36G]|nr:hypothetical protein LJT99_09515 [Lentisphaerae bacterium WC36]
MKFKKFVFSMMLLLTSMITTPLVKGETEAVPSSSCVYLFRSDCAACAKSVYYSPTCGCPEEDGSTIYRCYHCSYEYNTYMGGLYEGSHSHPELGEHTHENEGSGDSGSGDSGSGDSGSGDSGSGDSGSGDSGSGDSGSGDSGSGDSGSGDSGSGDSGSGDSGSGDSGSGDSGSGDSGSGDSGSGDSGSGDSGSGDSGSGDSGSGDSGSGDSGSGDSGSGGSVTSSVYYDLEESKNDNATYDVNAYEMVVLLEFLSCQESIKDNVASLITIEGDGTLVQTVASGAKRFAISLPGTYVIRGELERTGPEGEPVYIYRKITVADEYEGCYLEASIADATTGEVFATSKMPSRIAADNGEIFYGTTNTTYKLIGKGYSTLEFVHFEFYGPALVENTLIEQKKEVTRKFVTFKTPGVYYIYTKAISAWLPDMLELYKGVLKVVISESSSNPGDGPIYYNLENCKKSSVTYDVNAFEMVELSEFLSCQESIKDNVASLITVEGDGTLVKTVLSGAKRFAISLPGTYVIRGQLERTGPEGEPVYIYRKITVADEYEECFLEASITDATTGEIFATSRMPSRIAADNGEIFYGTTNTTYKLIGKGYSTLEFVHFEFYGPALVENTLIEQKKEVTRKFVTFNTPGVYYIYTKAISAWMPDMLELYKGVLKVVISDPVQCVYLHGSECAACGDFFPNSLTCGCPEEDGVTKYKCYHCSYIYITTGMGGAYEGTHSHPELGEHSHDSNGSGGSGDSGSGDSGSGDSGSGDSGSGDSGSGDSGSGDSGSGDSGSGDSGSGDSGSGDSGSGDSGSGDSGSGDSGSGDSNPNISSCIYLYGSECAACGDFFPNSLTCGCPEEDGVTKYKCYHCSYIYSTIGMGGVYEGTHSHPELGEHTH